MPVKIRPEILAVPAYRQGAVPQKPGFKLSSNENPFTPLPGVLEAIAKPLPGRYAGQAMPELRVKIGEMFNLDASTSETHVHLGAGSVTILYQLIQAVAGPGDEFIFAWPSFEGYPLLGLASGATAKRVALTEKREHDLRAMAEAVTSKTRAILLCSPNNPTGPTIKRADFDDFMGKIPNDVLVVLDEAYREFVTDPEAVKGEEVLAEYQNLVVLRTFSKAYGLASLRLGYGVGNPNIWSAAKVTGIPLSLTSQAEAAALAALEPEAQEVFRQQVSKLNERREHLRDGLIALGYSVPEAQGNFVWVDLGEKSEAFAKLFFDEGILVRPFAGDGVRITVGEEESLAPVLELASRFLLESEV